MSASTSYSQYGWSVIMHRLAAEFSTLQTTGVQAFTVQGSGSATVITPASFASDARYLITVSSGTGTRTVRLRATKAHSLQITVPLGPSDTTQEYSLGGPPEPSPGTTVYATRVTIQRQRQRR
jgi:hypothetical protein